ncbi:MAG TPA: CDP-alcohol phosphatidyltransferase family protein [Polyangia bacterium]|nr:CDP-alcohol phosphatidyltransferase family protein [Polyangia bacterium]
MTSTPPRAGRSGNFTAANAVTVVRILLIPCFGFLWWRGMHAAALAVFAVASLSDWLDGFLARVMDQRTRLGQILDPAADKLLLLVSFLTAAALGAVPRWLAALVIGRDVVLASGGALFAFVLRGRLEPQRWKPSRIGKYSTFVQVLTIALALTENLTRWPPLGPYVGVFTIHCAVLTTISGVQYVAFGVSALASGKLRSGGSA